MKNNMLKKMVRPQVEGFVPYAAGKPIEMVKRELGLKKVIKLASNENPLGPSKLALNALKKTLGKAFFYPDSDSFELKAALAKRFSVAPKNIVLGCGSDELIEMVGRAFFLPKDEIIASEHAFTRYQMSGKLMGSKVISVKMAGYKHDLDAMLKKVTTRTKAIFIANPNNPTGTYNTKNEVTGFLKGLKRKAPGRLPIVIMDEAYYEYARASKDYPETLKLLGLYPNLLILRTFSKIFGLAGLRIGYGFASEQLAGYIERVRPPFNINLLAQAAATACINDAAQVKRSLALVKQEKKYLYGELNELGFEFVPSAANFILVNVSPMKSSEVFQKLLKQGVIVRAMDEYNLPYHVRVSIGLKEENRCFIRALRKLVE
jgi:histidinol-phosphate aminotransferase